MEQFVGPLVSKLIAAGGGFLLGAIMLLLYLLERKQNVTQSKEIIKMSKDNTEAITRVGEVLNNVQETLREVARRV